MAPIKVGDTIPTGTFTHVPYTQELESGLVCGIPIGLSTNEWKDKKVVLFSVPGAFTPTCHVNHLPPYIQKYDLFKDKGVDVIAVVAANDAFVMSGWGKVLGVGDRILTLSDPGAAWSGSLGLDLDLAHLGFGTRTSRYALVIDNLVVKYVGVDKTVLSESAADAVLASL